MAAEEFLALGVWVVSDFAVSAAGLSVTLPSGKVLLALIPLFALLAGLILYCLVDLIRAPSVRYLPKLVWALIIVLVSVPFGALGYLVFGKDRHGHDLAGSAGRRGGRHRARAAGRHTTAGR